MNKKETLLVLEIIAQNPNTELKNLHKEINDKISWKRLLQIFSDLNDQEYIIRGMGALGAKITPLGETLIRGLNEEIQIENKIQKLTIKELEGNVFHVKKWWLIVIINFILSILTGILIFLIDK